MLAAHTTTPASGRGNHQGFWHSKRRPFEGATRRDMSGSWLQQVTSWWQTRRAPPAAASGPAAAPAGASSAGGGALEVLDSPHQQASPTSKEHLIVMVHGLFGSRDNWNVISQLLAEHLDPSTTLLFVSHCNERQKTFEGIDVCGERLAAEIQQVAARHPSLRRISLLGHSMGGLISRYAAGRLFDPGSCTLAGLKPCHFVAMASPHLGCEAQYSPAQVPLINWLSSVPALGGPAQRIISELAAPVSQAALGRAGHQFFLTDTDGGSGNSTGGSSGSGNGSSGSQRGGGATDGLPLICRLTQDRPQEGLLFLSALAAFETRTLYANSSGDHLVGWANASLRRLHELPPKHGRGTGVIYEDPLEYAWHPQQRPRLHATPAAAELHSGEAHRVSEAAILAAQDAGQLAASGAAVATSSADVAEPPPVGANSSSGSSSSSSSSALSRSPAAAAAAPALPSAEWSLQAAGVSAASDRERRLEFMLSRLQALSWRRVDVCFGATLLPLLSHQHIQVQRWWVNWAGEAVVKHLALQLQAMEQLRQQVQQQQQQQQQVMFQQQQQQEHQQQQRLGGAASQQQSRPEEQAAAAVGKSG